MSAVERFRGMYRYTALLCAGLTKSKQTTVQEVLVVIDIEIYKDEADGTITLCWDNYIYEAPDIAEEIWSYADLAEKMLFLPDEVLTFGEPKGKLVFVQKFYVED